MLRGLKLNDLSCDVGFCFYEDSLETVKRAIESFRHHVRYIFAIDGKFEFFESDKHLSPDNVRDYLKSVSNVILVDAPNKKENEKRQTYLDLAEKYKSDFIMILDADCYVSDITDWDLFYEDLITYAIGDPKIICIGVKLPHKISYFPLLWWRPSDFEYTKTHNFWLRKTDNALIKSTNDGINRTQHMIIKQNDNLRNKDYIQKSMDYQHKLIDYEKPFKIKYRETAINTSKVKDWDTFHGVPMV